MKASLERNEGFTGEGKGVRKARWMEGNRIRKKEWEGGKVECMERLNNRPIEGLMNGLQ